MRKTQLRLGSASKYGLTQAIAYEYAVSIKQHITAVQKAGKLLGVRQDLLDKHDASKWSDEEFWISAKHFKGGGAPIEWQGAWLHHIHWNPHHWQHWMIPRFLGRTMVEMPEHYVLEMIADWIGASEVYSNTTDISAWLKQFVPEIALHPHSASFARKILTDLNYGPVMQNLYFSTIGFG